MHELDFTRTNAARALADLIDAASPDPDSITGTSDAFPAVDAIAEYTRQAILEGADLPTSPPKA